MPLYSIRNRSSNNFVDEFLGIVIPAKSGTNEGFIVVDTADSANLLRAGGYLYEYFQNGTVTIGANEFNYSGSTPDIYVSPNIGEGENFVDVVSGHTGLTTNALRARYAYSILLNNNASQISYNGTGTNFLTNADNVQVALTNLDNQVAVLSGISRSLTWRPNVLFITSDPQFNTAGSIALSSLTFPISDDDTPQSITLTNFTEGTYILYKGTTPANDRLWRVVGTNLVLQTGSDGVQNNGYAYFVQYDLINNPGNKEKQSLWVYVTGQGLTKLADVEWGNQTLQNAYDGGNTIDIVSGRPILVRDNLNNQLINVTTNGSGNSSLTFRSYGTGSITLNAQNEVNIIGNNITFDDNNLSSPIQISETGQTSLISAEWDQQNNNGTTGNGVFDWSRSVTNIDVPVSIVGALNVIREDLNEYVTLINTPPTTTNVDANGANLIGVKGITGITPTGGTAGSNATLQAMLEGIALSAQNASLKSYADIVAFSAAKTSGLVSFKVGEIVYIRDSNRFVEVLTTGTGVVEDTDWSYVGGVNNSIGLSNQTYSISAGTISLANTLNIYTQGVGEPIVKVSNTSVFGLPVTTIPTLIPGQAGYTVFDGTEGKIYVYDSSRSKWISADRQLLQFGASSADGQYLSINGVTSGLTGFLIPRPAVITAITIKSAGNASNNLTKSFEIRANGAQIGTTKTLAGGIYSSITENIDVNPGDFLQIFATPTGGAAQNVVAVLEIAYRK